MRTVGICRLIAGAALTVLAASSVSAQGTEPTTREGEIEQEQQEKGESVRPYVPSKAEAIVNRAQGLLANGLKFHPFFTSAYSGGGFTLGAGYAQHVGAYNVLDVRGSYTISNYKRIEAEFIAPRLFHRRGALSVLGGWREAPQVGFFGLGTNTSEDDRTNYQFEEPYLDTTLTFRPTRRYMMLRGGLEFARWSQGPGEGSHPSVDTVYTPATLPGLGATATYVHTQGTFGFDWRTSPGYTRRGGFYGVTFHDYNDNDDEFGFEQIDYEAIQHFPILRETWVLSLHGLVQTAFDKDGQQIPFFMLPSVGGGSTLRGFSSWRFRDVNSLLTQAEWRIMVNRFLDTAFFFDAGKVTAHRSDLNLDGLKSDFGFGVRFHGPAATPLRVELAKSNEGLTIVFAASAAF